jgi:ribonuclease BN (tRNA processing enzyme)
MLRFIGSGDAFGSGGRLQTCMCLVGAGPHTLIDCGASTLIGLKGEGIDPNEVGVVVLTHLHGDHFAGVPYLVLDGQFRHRKQDLLVAGPPGSQARIEAAMEVLFPGSSAALRRFAISHFELPERTPTRVGPVEVTYFAALHASGAPSYSVRVEYGGKIVAYSGDTEWTEALVDVAAEADVFVCEGYYFDKIIRYHLSYTTLRTQRHLLTCRRLVLTHMSEDMLQRLHEVDAECAYDGLVLDL